jgi:hypothetical protein
MAVTTDKSIRRITARANAHQDAMRGMPPDAALKYIGQIVADNDVVIAVFPDPAEPHGVGFYPIKGRQQLEALRAGRIPERLHCDVVPCAELEHAIATEQRFRDKANLRTLCRRSRQRLADPLH